MTHGKSGDQITMVKHRNLIKHDPENGQYGDCHRACFATILGLEPENIPHFYGNPDEDGQAKINSFLRDLGLGESTTYFQGETTVEQILEVTKQHSPGVPLILGGWSRTGCNHSVVIIDGEIYNDPTEAGIIGPLSNGFYAVTALAVLPGYGARVIDKISDLIIDAVTAIQKEHSK